MPRPRSVCLLALLALAAPAAGCGDVAQLTVAEGSGPDPVLPPPAETLLPTVEIAAAAGWPEGQAPAPAPGLAVVAFADDLDHPRWLHVLPNGDVLVAESRAPGTDESSGIEGAITKHLFEIAGAAGPSADRISLLRDTDGDGVADLQTVLVNGLASPFGMTFLDDSLFVANSGSLVRFSYRLGQTRIDAVPDTVVQLPLEPYNQHWTRNVIASPDGATLYVAVGSASNIAEHGLDAEEGRAAIWAIDRATGQTRIYASGLRNPVGLAFEPTTGALWTAVNERDELGSDLVPDYMTSVRDGGFYGWPWTYWGGVVDERVEAPRPPGLSDPIRPDYALGPHTASLGLAWVGADGVAGEAGMVVGQHGSWNRKPRSGYKVVFVPFANGEPTGLPRDLLTGFLADDDVHAYGRPVGVAVAADGALLVADDVGNTIWRVTRD